MEKKYYTSPAEDTRIENNDYIFPYYETKNNKSSIQENTTTALKVLTQYAKARWLIFNFPWATFVALMIAYNGAIDIPVAVLTVGSSYLILLATYTYNDAQDLEVDKVNDPNRPLASGKVTKEYIIKLTWILNGVALLMAGLVNIQVFVIAGILVILGILYSHPKTSFKDRFPYKTLVTSFGAMLASFLGGFAADNFSYNVIYAGVAFFAFCTVLALLGDISDLRGDKANGRRTLPIIIGQKNTSIIIYAALASMIMLTTWLYYTNGISIINTILAVSICILSMIRLSTLFRNEEVKKIKKLRPPMRILSFTFQLVLLIGLFM